MKIIHAGGHLFIINYMKLASTLMVCAVLSFPAALVVRSACVRVMKQAVRYVKAWQVALLVSGIIGTLQWLMVTIGQNAAFNGIAQWRSATTGSVLMVPIGLTIHSLLVNGMLKAPMGQAWKISFRVLGIGILIGLAVFAVLFLFLMYAWRGA